MREGWPIRATLPSGTAASLIVVARMTGITLSLAALSAWGVEHFQAPTTALEFRLPLEEATSAALQERLDSCAG